MGHAPHPTQSLVNSCEEFYQAKQLFSLTQGNWHVLAQLQKDSSVPKCKNILRIAKKKLQGGQSSNKICSLVRGKIYAHKHVQVRLICCRFAFATARLKGSHWSHWEHWRTEKRFLCGVETICSIWGFNSKHLQDEAWVLCPIISKMRGSISFVLLFFGNSCLCNIRKTHPGM